MLIHTCKRNNHANICVGFIYFIFQFLPLDSAISQYHRIDCLWFHRVKTLGDDEDEIVIVWFLQPSVEGVCNNYYHKFKRQNNVFCHFIFKVTSYLKMRCPDLNDCWKLINLLEIEGPIFFNILITRIIRWKINPYFSMLTHHIFWRKGNVDFIRNHKLFK